MDNDRIEGTGTRAQGSVKEAVGKLTGAPKLDFKGQADKAGGKIGNVLGGVKNAVRGVLCIKTKR